MKYNGSHKIVSLKRVSMLSIFLSCGYARFQDCADTDIARMRKFFFIYAFIYLFGLYLVKEHDISGFGRSQNQNQGNKEPT